MLDDTVAIVPWTTYPASIRGGKPNAVELQMQDLAVKEHQFYLQEVLQADGRLGYSDPIQVDWSIVDSAPWLNLV